MKSSKRTSAESYAELTRLQRLRSDLEDELSDKKLTQEKREQLEAELTKTREAIKYVR